MPFAQHETRWQGGNLRLTFDAIHRDHGVACLATQHPSMLTAETLQEGEPRARVGDTKSHATCSSNARTAERANKVFAPRSQFADADVDALVRGFPPARIIFRDHHGHGARRHQKASVIALNYVVGWRAVVVAAAFERVPVMGVGSPWPVKQPCPHGKAQTTRRKVTQWHSCLARTGPHLNCDRVGDLCVV